MHDATTAAQVLIQTEIRDDRLIEAAARRATTAAQVLIQTEIRDDRLIEAAARRATTAAQVLIQTEIRDGRLIAAVVSARHDLSSPQRINQATWEDNMVAKVLAARSDLTDPALIAAVVRRAETVLYVLEARSDLRQQRTVIDQIRERRAVLHAVVDRFGPYPALWRTLPPDQQHEIADRYRMTPDERTWLHDLTTRSPLVWTESDAQLAARFPWSIALHAMIHDAGTLP